MPTTGDFITSLVLKFFIDNGGLACDVENHIVGALHTELYAYMCMFLIYEHMHVCGLMMFPGAHRCLGCLNIFFLS